VSGGVKIQSFAIGYRGIDPCEDTESLCRRCAALPRLLTGASIRVRILKVQLLDVVLYLIY